MKQGARTRLFVNAITGLTLIVSSAQFAVAAPPRRHAATLGAGAAIAKSRLLPNSAVLSYLDKKDGISYWASCLAVSHAMATAVNQNKLNLSKVENENVVLLNKTIRFYQNNINDRGNILLFSSRLDAYYKYYSDQVNLGYASLILNDYSNCITHIANAYASHYGDGIRPSFSNYHNVPKLNNDQNFDACLGIYLKSDYVIGKRNLVAYLGLLNGSFGSDPNDERYYLVMSIGGNNRVLPYKKSDKRGNDVFSDFYVTFTDGSSYQFFKRGNERGINSGVTIDYDIVYSPQIGVPRTIKAVGVCAA